MSRPLKNLFFYQNKKLTTIKTGDNCQNIFQAPTLVIAKKTAESRNTTLFATDGKNSIFSTHEPGQSESYNYTAYGFTPLPASHYTTLAFNGELFDFHSGGYILGSYRTYKPNLMRLTLPDSESPFAEGGVNHSAYCKNDPINYIDPTGHTLKSIIGISSRPNFPRTSQRGEASNTFIKWGKELNNELKLPSYETSVGLPSYQTSIGLSNPKTSPDLPYYFEVSLLYPSEGYYELALTIPKHRLKPLISEYKSYIPTVEEKLRYAIDEYQRNAAERNSFHTKPKHKSFYQQKLNYYRKRIVHLNAKLSELNQEFSAIKMAAASIRQ